MDEFEEFSSITKKKIDLIDKEEQENKEKSISVEEWVIDEDVFEDENIEETLIKYNYDYKALVRELTTFINYSELLKILNSCGIKKRII